MIIRSYFGGMFRDPLPQAVPGYYSTQLLQRMDALVAGQARGGYGSYRELVGDQALPLKQ